MSSNVERALKAGAQAGAEEALLAEIGRRAPSPTQAVKVCQILGLASKENIRRVREIAKNKTAFDLVGRSPVLLAKAEAENKRTEEKEMRPVFLRLKGKKVDIYTSTSASAHCDPVSGTVVKVGKQYVELSSEGNGFPVFVNYRQIVAVRFTPLD